MKSDFYIIDNPISSTDFELDRFHHLKWLEWDLELLFWFQNGSGGTSPKLPIPTKEGKYSSDVSKGELLPKDPFLGFEEQEPGSTFFNSFLYSLSLITTVGKIF